MTIDDPVQERLDHLARLQALGSAGRAAALRNYDSRCRSAALTGQPRPSDPLAPAANDVLAPGQPAPDLRHVSTMSPAERASEARRLGLRLRNF